MPERAAGLSLHLKLRHARAASEAQNVISRAVLRAKAQTVEGETVALQLVHLGEEFRAVEPRAKNPSPLDTDASEARPGEEPFFISSTGSLRDSVDAFQTHCVEQALASNGWVWSHAAKSLGMHRANFHRLATRLGFKKPTPGPG